MAGGTVCNFRRQATQPAGTVASLDVSVLQDRLLDPILGIKDVRTDKRIDFIGGLRGTKELERLVDEGKAAVAFSLYPTTVAGAVDGLRRKRDHATQVDMVRTEVERRVVDTHDLIVNGGVATDGQLR